MTRKRKRLKKLLMGFGFDRDEAEWLSGPGWLSPPGSYAFRIELVCKLLPGKETQVGGQ